MHLATCLVMEFFFVRCLVEVQISSEDLIGALPGDHHLHSQRLDLTSHEEHWSARPDGSDVVRLNVIDYVLNSINPILNCEVELVMDSAKITCNLSRSLQIR